MASAAVAASIASGGVESVGFLNDIVTQLWDEINVAGSAMTKELVEPMFKELLPGPLSSLHFTKIDLGRTPIRFDNIDVHSRAENVIKLDVDVSWDGDCDIDLKANLIGSLGVEKVKLKGRMSVLLCPLVSRLPLVTAAQIAFINPPELSLDFTGLAEVADLCIIDDTIRKIIQDILAMILVLPNRLLVKIDPANDYFKAYQQHLGFLRLTVVSGRGFVTPKQFFKDVPDTYCKVRVGAHKTWKTSTKDNDLTPEWNETSDFLLSDHDQLIRLEVLDDDLARDDEIGGGQITVGKLLLAGKTAEIPLLAKDTDTGAKVTIKCDIFEFVPDITSFEDAAHEPKGLMCGLITIIVAGAFKVPGIRKDIGPNVKAYWGKEEFATPILLDMPGIDTNNPCFDCAFRIPLTTEKAADPSDFTLTLLDRKDKLGSISVPYADVLSAPGMTLKTDKLKLDNGSVINASISICGIKLAQ